MLKLMVQLLGVMALGYTLLCATAYVAQERLLFFPEYDPPGTQYNFGWPVEEVFIPVEGATLHALWFRTTNPTGVILYFHGNGGSLRSWGAVAPDFIIRGYEVVMVDYRGYGQSSGSISSEAQLLADAEAVYAWVLERYPESQVVLYGSSLGTGFASWLAANHQPSLLILESPFYSIETLARRMFPWVPSILLKYPLRTHSWIDRVRCPVVIFHGTNDTVIPFADGERLASTVTAPLTFYRLEGGGHVDFGRYRIYHEALNQALGPRRCCNSEPAPTYHHSCPMNGQLFYSE
ncbi:alpha/beta hydrolase [uncultured Chloroflexus sp.]|uniref:alpha/beta hydrolase n=3 Tax=uncultured Chloroflexus sp. TaxID=214040 RepID=UPI00260AC75F|nr:alpha/beta hydrolase [uncultured Chloroflexus sp.]